MSRPISALSPQQRRLWALGQAHGHASSEGVVRVRGACDPEALRRACLRVVERHEVLRTRFRLADGEQLPRPVVGDADLAWSAAPASSAPRWQTATPWNLAEGPLVRCELRQLQAGELELHVSMPALLADATTLELFVDELAESLREPSPPRAAAGPGLTFGHYAGWQNELLAGPDSATARELWQDRRLAMTPPASLPELGPVTAGTGSEPAPIEVPIAPRLGAEIEAFCRANGREVASFFLACWQVLCSRLTDRDEGRLHRRLLAVGVAARSSPDLAAVLGPCDRFLPLASEPWADLGFRELLRRLDSARDEARELLDFFDPAAWPGEGDPPHLPLAFEALAPPPARQAGELLLEVTERRVHHDRWQLSLRVTRRDDGGDGGPRWTGELLCDPARFPRREAALLVPPFLACCRAALELPDGLPERWSLLGPADVHELLVSREEPPAEAAAPSFIHLFEAQAARTPDRPAATSGGRTCTYGELRTASRKLGHHLRALGVGPDQRVAVALDRSLEWVVAVLGVMQAGGAYVPLDPALPYERLATMLRESAAVALLGQEGSLTRLPPAPAVVCLDRDRAAVAERPEHPVDSGLEPENLVYVLFTSGSTGRPKAVSVSHGQLVHYASAVRARLELPDGLGFALVSTLAADLGNTALFPTLLAGGCVHLLLAEQTLDPLAFQAYLETHAVDALKIVPSHLQALQDRDRPGRSMPGRRLVLGGEAATPEWLGRLRSARPDCRIDNHYGPTETTVGVLTHTVGAADGLEALPLGRPLAGTRALVLDGRLEAVPRGRAGEIVVGGPQVARGYLGQPAATAERFVPDPWAGEPGARMYRTGDRGRWRADGLLTFLGRVDRQVKIRGFRVELGEIEQAVRSHPAIDDVAVEVRGAGARRLVCWFVPKPGRDAGEERLRAQLGQRLPEPMIPDVFIQLDALPLNANGKVDRRALREPDETNVRLVEPRNHQERVLLAIWQELLGRREISVDDDFFRLGGDSALAIQLIARASEVGIRLTPRHVFEHHTVAALAAATAAPSAPWSSGWPWGDDALVPLRPEGSKVPFFCVHPAGGTIVNLLALEAELEPEQPFYALQDPAFHTDRPLAPSLESLAADYVREIRTVRASGPYLLGGHSFGGVVAFEIGRQLEEAGETVAAIVLLDTEAPGTRSAESADDAAILLHITTILAGFGGHGPVLSADELAPLAPAEQVQLAVDRLGTLPVESRMDLSYFTRFYRVYKHHARLARRYRPGPWHGPLTLVRGRDRELAHEARADLGWGELALQGVAMLEVPGDHTTMLSRRFAPALARELERCFGDALARTAKRPSNHAERCP